MDLEELAGYFQSHQGTGVLATADEQGRVNAAVYGRPHFLEPENALAFIMPHKLTHVNLEANPHACYLFQEEGQKARGKRLYLTKIGEDTDQEFIARLRRSQHGDGADQRFLVKFAVDKVLPLVGAGPGQA